MQSSDIRKEHLFHYGNIWVALTLTISKYTQFSGTRLEKGKLFCPFFFFWPCSIVCRIPTRDWTSVLAVKATSPNFGLPEGNSYPLQYSCLENSMDREPGRLQSMGSQRVGHNWANFISLPKSLLFKEGGRHRGRHAQTYTTRSEVTNGKLTH